MFFFYLKLRYMQVKTGVKLGGRDSRHSGSILVSDSWTLRVSDTFFHNFISNFVFPNCSQILCKLNTFTKLISIYISKSRIKINLCHSNILHVKALILMPAYSDRYSIMQDECYIESTKNKI